MSSFLVGALTGMVLFVIAALDGMVNPSLVCPEDGCDWHVFVRLVGWGSGS